MLSITQAEKTNIKPVSGIASVAQILAYSHSTTQVHIKLYKQLTTGPAQLQQHQPGIRSLLAVVDSLRKRPVPVHIIITLIEVSTLATKALSLIAQSSKKGYFSLYWSAVYTELALAESLSSLAGYEDILHLADSVETWQATEPTHCSLTS